MKNYIKKNQLSYDAVAHEYKERAFSYLESDEILLRPFFSLIDSKFPKTPCRILDLGCGCGLNLLMFSKKNYISVGIDISRKMLEAARSISPNSILINGDFLSDIFFDESFEAILSKASLHNFSKEDAIVVLNKAFRLLVPGGVFFVATTVSQQSEEGFFKKKDYKSPISRFRKYWTPTELEETIESAGFKISNKYYNDNIIYMKNWYNIIAVKA